MTDFCGVLILILNHCRLERPAHVIGLVQKFLSEKLKVWAMVTFLLVIVIVLLDKMDVSGDGDVVTNDNDGQSLCPIMMMAKVDEVDIEEAYRVEGDTRPQDVRIRLTLELSSTK